MTRRGVHEANVAQAGQTPDGRCDFRAVEHRAVIGFAKALFQRLQTNQRIVGRRCLPEMEHAVLDSLERHGGDCGRFLFPGDGLFHPLDQLVEAGSVALVMTKLPVILRSRQNESSSALVSAGAPRSARAPTRITRQGFRWP